MKPKRVGKVHFVPSACRSEAGWGRSKTQRKLFRYEFRIAFDGVSFVADFDV